MVSIRVGFFFFFVSPFFFFFFFFSLSNSHSYLFSVSPLWALKSFQHSFFKRLGICWLHVFLQGIFRSSLAAITKDLTQVKLNGMWWWNINFTMFAFFVFIHNCMTRFLAEINARVCKTLGTHPTFTKFYKTLLYKRENKQKEKVVKVIPTSGSVLYSLQEVIVGCLIGYAKQSLSFSFLFPPRNIESLS